MSAHPLSESEICELVTGFPLDRVAVLDTETTGLDTESDEILSIAVCDGLGKKLVEYLVKPDHHKSWPDAQAVNGISPEMVRNAPSIGEVAPNIRDALLGNRIIVGYNVRYDIEMLLGCGVLQEWPRTTFDVMREYAYVHGDEESPYGRGYRYTKLGRCAAHYGYSFSAHDAMQDVLATLWCFRALLADPAWLHTRLDGMAERLRSISVSQTKETTANVLHLVDMGITAKTEGTLKLGKVSRGKSAGSPRYELYVSEAKVGVVTAASMSKIIKYLQADDGESLPEEIACSVILSASGPKAHASVEIVCSSNVISAAYDGASITRSRCGNAWRERIAEEHHAESARAEVMRTQAKPKTKDSSWIYGCLVLLGMALAIIYAAIAMVSCAASR